MSVVFSYDSEPISERLDRVRQAVSESLVPLDIRPAGGPAALHDRIVSGELGPVRVGELTTFGPGTTALRTPKLIKQWDPDLVKIDVLVTGQVTIDQDGRQARLGAGDLAFVDLSRPCTWTIPVGRMVAISFPRTLLPIHPDKTSKLTGTRIPGGQGTGALVSSFIRQLPRHLDDHGMSGQARLGTAVLDLIAGTMAVRLGNANGIAAESRQRALLLRISAFVEQRLDDPELSPTLIAAAHHISVRYLYRLLESQGTSVVALIRNRRLERCHKDLLDPAFRERPVSAIAARWGLTNAAHFSRLFRARYGLPPAEFRHTYQVS